MTNAETKKHILEWVKKPHGLFSWPTDGCGYEQHLKFVKFRNEHWDNYDSSWDTFVIAYAQYELEEKS